MNIKIKELGKISCSPAARQTYGDAYWSKFLEWEAFPYETAHKFASEHAYLCAKEALDAREERRATK
jgi:hypothetical protein